MTTLRIDDLSHSNELDAIEMAAVSGSGVAETVGNMVNTVAAGIDLGLFILAGGGLMVGHG